MTHTTTVVPDQVALHQWWMHSHEEWTESAYDRWGEQEIIADIIAREHNSYDDVTGAWFAAWSRK